MKTYSDSTFQSWNKKELIEYIRMVESNYHMAVVANERQADFMISMWKDMEDIAPPCPPRGVVREFDNGAVVMSYDTYSEYNDIAVREAIRNNPNI